MSPTGTSPARTWFVTGTDTDAGKTSVARALLLAAQHRGQRACGYKPVESGATKGQGPDALALAAAAAAEVQSSYVFTPPVAPLHAAKLAGETISIGRIQQQAEQLRHATDLLIIEGAGGLLVPLAPGKTIADLVMALEAPVLIVAADTLGAINHSLLTIECARQRGIKVDALVLSEREIGGGNGLGNREQIEEYGQLPVLSLPHAKSVEELASAGETLLEALLSLNT